MTGDLMKKLLAILLAFGFNFVYAKEIINVGVKGMVCASCTSKVEKRFKNKSEVESIKVSLGDRSKDEKALGQVNLTLKEGAQLTDEVIKDLISNAGFEAISIERK